MKAIEYLDQFQEDKKNKYSKLTIKSYVSDIGQFCKFIGRDLEEAGWEDVERFKGHVLSRVNIVTKKPYRPQTVNKKLIALRQFIDWINTHTEIKIFLEVNLLEIQRQESLPENLLSNTEFERIIAATQDGTIKGMQARALLYGLYYTGTRISELLQIKVSDMSNLDVWVKGKGAKYREVPIADKLKPWLQEYITAKELKLDDFVFVNRNNRNVMSRQTAHNIIKFYGGKAKIKLTKAHLHNLRHLFCLTMLQKGVSIEDVADLAGHNNINTTRRYTRKSKGELRNTLDRL